MGPVKQWHASTEASHQRGTGGAIAEVSEALYPATSDIDVLGQDASAKLHLLFTISKYTFYIYRMNV